MRARGRKLDVGRAGGCRPDTSIPQPPARWASKRGDGDAQTDQITRSSNPPQGKHRAELAALAEEEAIGSAEFQSAPRTAPEGKATPVTPYRNGTLRRVFANLLLWTRMTPLNSCSRFVNSCNQPGYRERELSVIMPPLWVRGGCSSNNQRIVKIDPAIASMHLDQVIELPR